MSNDFNELQRAVGRIEGKLDTLIGLTSRVSSLERWRAWTAGAGVAGGIILSALWHVLTTVVNGR